MRSEEKSDSGEPQELWFIVARNVWRKADVIVFFEDLGDAPLTQRDTMWVVALLAYLRLYIGESDLLEHFTVVVL